MFPAAPVLPDGNRVVPHGLREVLMLRHLGYKVPNPVDFYYDWCGGTPYAVQRATCRMLTENPHAYVLNHMGTGKTKTALWAWDYLNKQGLAKKLLVVAPLSTLRFVWAAEAFRTLPGRRVEILHGSRQARLDALSRDADIYVINHDGLRVIETELWTRADIDTLVLDELAVYRNNSDRSKRMRKFANRFSIVWGMTGAPMPNEPTDVWAQCMIVTPGRVPRYQGHAREMLMTHVSNYLWRPKPDAEKRAFGWMQPSCRYALEDVVELPPLISRTVDVPLSAEQEKVYKRVATAMVADIKDKRITALNAGAAMNKLLQIAGGWVYTQRPEFVRVDPSPRIVAMADLIRSANNKVLIAVPYRHMIDGISRIFNMKGVEIDHCCVHGDTPDRERLFNLFQNTDKYQSMLAHPGCVHHGLTLTAADMIIWYLPFASLDVYDQFNARITRIGQLHKQQLLHLQATPVERKLYRMLRDHQKMQNSFLELVEEATGTAL
jgi:SNF2 family DNA or RNA helicase